MTSESFSQDEAERLLSASRRALLLYRLTEREQQVAEIILQWSFGRDRAEALIPDLRYFVELTGIDKGDVSRALSRMVDRGIVQVRDFGRDPHGRKLRAYAFRPHAAWWKDAPCRVDVERALATAAELDEINDGRAPMEPGGQTFDGTICEARNEFADGLSAASREETLKAAAPGREPSDAHTKDAARFVRDAQTQVPATFAVDGQRPPSVAGTRGGETPTHGQIGDSPIRRQIGETPTLGRDARTRAPDVLNVKNTTSVTLRNVSAAADGPRRFADADRNLVMEKIEKIVGKSFGRYRGYWVGIAARLSPQLLLEAIGDTESYVRGNKVKTEPGAILHRRIQTLCSERGIALKR